MALPTTNLTGHWDASTNAELYKAFSGGMLVNNPADGEDFVNWRNALDATNQSSTQTIGEEDISHSISWHDDTVLRLPSVRINSGRLRTESAGGIGHARTLYMPNDGKTMLLSFYLDGGASTIPNHANVFQNCVLAGEIRNSFFGLFIKQPSAGVYELHAYNWDGDPNDVSLPLSADTPHTVCVVHDGANLTLSMDCGTPVSVASGNTTSTTGSMIFGDTGNNGTTTAEFRGRFGEVALYDAALSGADLAAAKAYFCTKWLTISGLTIVGSAMFGTKGRLTSSRTHLVNLDNVQRTVSAETSLVVGGNLMLIEQASAPAGVANAVRLFTEDNGSGKTRLMAQFGTGSAVQVAIEP